MKIPYKIFGVAILVFALMGSSIVFSTYKLYQVSKEVTDLAEVFIPLSDQIAEIDLQIAQQELHVERLEKHLTGVKLIDEELRELDKGIVPEHLLTGSETVDEKRARLEAENTHLKNKIAEEEEDFETRETNVDAAIKNAENIVAKAVATAVTVEGQNTLKTLLPLLQSVDQQHSNLHAQMTLLITAFKQDSPMLFELEKLIEEEEDQLAENMVATWQRIAHFTESAAKKAEEHERQALIVNIVLAAISGVLALLLSGLVIKGMLQPLRRLMDGTSEVESGDLSGEIEAGTRDEIGDLTRSFNNMVQELRKTEEIKDKFGQYVDPRVVSGLIGDPNMELVNGEKKVVSVFFADFANFTGISERFTPGGLVKLINRYLALMSEPVTENHGLIDKYIGDAIMAFWAPPFCADGEQASLAVAAAMKDASLIGQFREELPDLMGLRRDLPDIGMRIGIATGDAVVGSIGSEKTKNYTVIGDTVNLGSRLESANKVYGTDILVCKRTCEMASSTFEFRKIDDLIVSGKTEPVSIFEPLGPVGEVADEALAYRDQFEQALVAFAAGDWSRAAGAFLECRKSNGDDPATEAYVRRLAVIKRNGPPADWDGVWRLDTK
jgi:adenylate cyclase